MIASFLNRVSGVRPVSLAIAGVLLAAGGVVSAAPIAYTSTYNADASPESSGNPTPTAANPNWHIFLSTTGAASVSSGVLTVNTINGSQNQAWNIGYDGASNVGNPNSAWSADPNKLTSVEFNVQITADTGERPFVVDVADGTSRLGIFFGASDINYGTATSVLHDNTQATTYRIDFKDGKVSLYDETHNQTLLNNVVGNAAASRNWLLFGDDSNSYHGSFSLDYIRWNNNVPEPGMSGLIGGAMMMGLGLRHRKKGH